MICRKLRRKCWWAARRVTSFSSLGKISFEVAYLPWLMLCRLGAGQMLFGRFAASCANEATPQSTTQGVVVGRSPTGMEDRQDQTSSSERQLTRENRLRIIEAPHYPVPLGRRLRRQIGCSTPKQHSSPHHGPTGTKSYLVAES
jgi:hypothetical protein